MFIRLLLVCISVIFMVQKSHADPFNDLQVALPDSVNGWEAESPDRIFDPESIFSYINGGAEVYRAYNMRQCLSRQFNKLNSPGIVLDLFDMGSSVDAYGVFTHDRSGQALNTGQGGLYNPGWLRFWKDRFFVSIYMEEENHEVEKAVKKLGNNIASLIKTQGPLPRVVTLLPTNGLQSKSIRFLHHHVILNYHFFLSNENILNLGTLTDAALAEYQRGNKKARLMVVSYENKEKAEKGLFSLRKHYMPDADSSGVVMLENKKWSAAAVSDRLLCVVFDSDTKKLAVDLIKSVTELASQK